MRYFLTASLLSFLLNSIALAQLPSFPSTGKAVKGFEPLDDAVIAIMRRHGIPGASLAIAKDGKLLVAKGYGWANLDTDERARPDTLFGIASLSKSLTAVAILKLVEQGKLKLDDKPFAILSDIQPHPGARSDTRLKQITIHHLLIHAGGWDARRSGDPVNWATELQLFRGDKLPVTAKQLMSFTMGMPLDFEPGTGVSYSNFGYIVLGEVIEKISGTTYEKYVREQVLKPAGITAGGLHPASGKYLTNEARRYLPGGEIEIPLWKQQYSDAAGGWTMSAIDLVRFLTALDGSRGKPILQKKMFDLMLEPPPLPILPRLNGTWTAPGWDIAIKNDAGFGFAKDGLWLGMRTFMKRSPNGYAWALLFNSNMQMDALDNFAVMDAVKRVLEKVELPEKLAQDDLFEEYK